MSCGPREKSHRQAFCIYTHVQREGNLPTFNSIFELETHCLASHFMDISYHLWTEAAVPCSISSRDIVLSRSCT